MGEARQLPGAKGAGVGQGTVGLTLHVALVLPLGEVPQGGHLCGVLHPLDNLNITGVRKRRPVARQDCLPVTW